MKEGIKPKNLPEVNDRRKSSSPLVPGRRDFLRNIIFGSGVGLPRYLKLLKAITGWQWSEEYVNIIGERILNLERCFNVREGFRRQDDYYRHREWALTTGVPTIHKPQSLRFIFAAEELEKLGIYGTQRE